MASAVEGITFHFLETNVSLPEVPQMGCPKKELFRF
jgi:hypothetical protein